MRMRNSLQLKQSRFRPPPQEPCSLTKAFMQIGVIATGVARQVTLDKICLIMLRSFCWFGDIERLC